MTSDTDSAGPLPPHAPPLELSEHSTIDTIAQQWDQLVRRDAPHLRSGFIRAAERGEMMIQPSYYLVRSGDRVVAVALSFTVMSDGAMSASPGARKRIAWIRKIFPRYKIRPMRICGPPVSNGESGFCFDPESPAPQCDAALRMIVAEIEASAGRKQMIFVKEFNDEAMRDYASQLGELGFFQVDPGPATSMAICWDSFDDYLGALKKRYRRRIRSDLKAGKDLEITLLDSFADLAPTAAALYEQVVARAQFNLEQATAGFFEAVSDFDQAALLVARQRGDGEVVGVNLLLFGETCMHNLYIGFDYETNREYNTYFNLVEESLKVAIRRKLQVCYFGPASYEFKTRLGATTFPLAAFMKHPIKFVHRYLQSNQETLWPQEVIPSHDVFQDS